MNAAFALSFPAIVRRALTIALLVATIASPVRARNVDEIENPRQDHAGWVTDEPGLLGSHAGQLEERLESLHQQLGAEVAWVILQTIGDRDPREFGTALLRHWGVGRKEQDDGVLVLHVLDRRRIEIVTGYGAEGALPDIKCAWLLQEVAVPAFRANQFARGHLALSSGIVRALLAPDISHADLIAAALQDDTQLASTPTPAAKRRASSRKATQGAESWRGPLLGVLGLTLLIWRARVYRKLSPAHSGCDLIVSSGFVLFIWLFALVFSEEQEPFALSLFSIGLGFLLMRGLRDVRTLRARMAPLPCRVCPRKLRWVEGEEAVALMSAGARKEHELGSMRFEVRRCDCGEAYVEGFDVESKIRRCPGCGFRTLAGVRERTLKAATAAEAGQTECIFVCAHCSRQVLEVVEVPRLSFSSSSDSGSSSSWSSDSSSDSSSSSFGGGDTGGGGAGASY